MVVSEHPENRCLTYTDSRSVLIVIKNIERKDLSVVKAVPIVIEKSPIINERP